MTNQDPWCRSWLDTSPLPGVCKYVTSIHRRNDRSPAGVLDNLERNLDDIFAVDELAVEIGQHVAQFRCVEGLKVLASDQLGEKVPHLSSRIPMSSKAPDVSN